MTTGDVRGSVKAVLHADVVIPAETRRFYRAEYDRLIDLGFFQRERLELIHGCLIKMSPIGPSHRRAVHYLDKLLQQRISDRAEVFVQQPFAASDDSEPEPDISVVPTGEYADDHPRQAYLIVEVADSSLEYHRRAKVPLYAASSVDEYWIVNLVERVLEVYSEPVGGQYTQTVRLRADAVVAPRAFPDVTISVGSLLPR